MGTCIPSDILGANGIIPLKQTLLESLSLTTDSTCDQSYDADCDIELSSFCKLQSLSWRAPNAVNIEALSVVIPKNSAHLQKLELDFVNWPELRDSLALYSDDEDENDITAENYFAAQVLRLNIRSPRILLPAIRVLSLSQVPLVAEMASAINFDTVASLTLRSCPAWDKFLGRVLELNLPIKLRALEIQESDDVASGWGEHILASFLDAFEGLEELSISHLGPTDAIELWDHTIHHQTTLKRFVYHQRIINIDDESSNLEEEEDFPYLTILGPSMQRIRENPLQNPLARLDLECIGLACIPGRLVSTQDLHDARVLIILLGRNIYYFLLHRKLR